MPADTHEEKPGHICWFTRSGQNMKHLISHAHVRLYIRTLLLYVLTTEHHRLTVGRKVGQNVQQNARAHTHTHTLVDAFSTCTDKIFINTLVIL